MSIVHIVLFKISAENSCIIEALKNDFLNLQKDIQEIAEISWGTNISTEWKHKWFTLCFSLHFKNIEHRNSYLEDKNHINFVEKYSKFLEDVLVFDYHT